VDANVERILPRTATIANGDFGALNTTAREFFWKIDYYDHTMTEDSESPSDPSQTVRLLTTMQGASCPPLPRGQQKSTSISIGEPAKITRSR
jgi:hypothetical protein